MKYFFIMPHRKLRLIPSVEFFLGKNTEKKREDFNWKVPDMAEWTGETTDEFYKKAKSPECWIHGNLVIPILWR
jgi:hypothetical protein